MSKFKKQLTFSGSENIWRLVNDDRNNLLIETRDTKTRQAFFTYINLETGKYILENFQPAEKFWCGIEKVQYGIIYFHGYAKPDLPGHKGISAFDISGKKFLWNREELVYSFFLEGKLFCIGRGFENNPYIAIDAMTGETLTDYGKDSEAFNQLMDKSREEEDYSAYLFPERYLPGVVSGVSGIFDEIIKKHNPEGFIEYINLPEAVIYNYHTKNKSGTFDNNFRIRDRETGRFLIEEIINSKTERLMPDCFYIKSDKLFLLKEKKKVLVYNCIK